MKRADAPLPRATALWNDSSLPLKLGCTVCPALQLCGGLHIAAPIFDCRSLCTCIRTGHCSGVCRRDPRAFLARIREIGGFAFTDIPRFSLRTTRAIPQYVPIIYAGTDRHAALDDGTVALPLLSLFNRASGTERFGSRDKLLQFFKLSSTTRLVLTGVDNDRSIERWWSFPGRPRLIDTLHALGVEMVTTPNYSLPTDVTRYDNMHNMKRILLTWSEFMAAGMPCALHLNARTDTDYRRWADFVAQREEVATVAFDFTTGTEHPVRGAWHRDQLVALAHRVHHPLHLVLRGGSRHLPQLVAAFSSVSLLDSNPYMKTKFRQRARFVIGAGLEWRSSPTAPGEPLDDLLRYNIDAERHSFTRQLAWLRTDHRNTETRDVRPLLELRSA